RQRPGLLGVEAEHERARVGLDGERLQRGWRRRLRAKLALEARVVEHHEPALAVECQARAAEEMVETHGERAQPPRRGESVDAVTVLLAEEQVAGLWIYRHAAERRLAAPVRVRNDEARCEGRVDRRRR